MSVLLPSRSSSCFLFRAQTLESDRRAARSESLKLARAEAEKLDVARQKERLVGTHLSTYLAIPLRISPHLPTHRTSPSIPRVPGPTGR